MMVDGRKRNEYSAYDLGAYTHWINTIDDLLDLRLELMK